jgi:hypothetical protein
MMDQTVYGFRVKIKSNKPRRKIIILPGSRKKVSAIYWLRSLQMAVYDEIDPHIVLGHSESIGNKIIE